MFKQKFVITSIDVDTNFELKLSSLFKFMQEVASNHVESISAGTFDLLKNNLLWVVIRADVKIYKTPKLNDVITITTHPGEQKSFIFPRYFEIYDKKGELLISSSGMWALINKETRRVVIKPEGLKPLKVEKDKDDLPLPEKINGDASTLVDTRRVKYSEVDLNGHLNNTFYISYILDTHDLDFYRHNRVCSLSINYDKEIVFNEEVSLYSNKEDKEIIKGKVGDTNHFTALIEYERR